MNIIQNHKENYINCKLKCNQRVHFKYSQTGPNFKSAVQSASKVAKISTVPPETVLAVQNGYNNCKVFTKQLIEQIFGNKKIFKLRTSSEDGIFHIHIASKFDNQEYINLCSLSGNENTGIVKWVNFDGMDLNRKYPFIASIMEHLSENEQKLIYDSKVFNIKKPSEPLATVKERANDIIKSSPMHLFYPLPDKDLVHSSDLINPNELSKMKFGEDYLLMVHDTKAPGITALVKKEGLKCYSDINPQEAASHKKSNNDPDLIYFCPLSPDYNIDENCIVIAVRKGAGVVFNQEWRPAGYYEPYIRLCNRFNSYHCFSGYKSNQSYGGITVPNIPEICYGDRHISPEYFVDINKLNSALIENNPNYNPAHTHKSPNSQSQSQNLQQVLTSLYNIFDK